jgi:hypothetical protein
MKRSAVCLLSLSILLCTQLAQAAPQPPAKPVSPQELFKEGKYAEAQTAYEAVISAKRNGEVKEQRAYAELLLGYARALAAQRKYDEAFKMISQASAIAEAFAMPGEFTRLIKTELEELRPKTTQTQQSPNYYVGYHSNRRDEHDAAEEEYLAKASINFAKERYGVASIMYLQRHIDYARFLSAQHRPDDLAKEASTCREVFSKLTPDFQAETAPQILELAETLANNRLPIEADTVGGIVLSNIMNGQLKNATQLATSLERVARALENGSQSVDNAQKYYAAAVSVFEKQAPADDPRLAQMRNALAAFYKKRGKNGSAIELLEMSVAAQQKNIALGSAEAIKALADLTELYCLTGNLAKAKESSQQLSDAVAHAPADITISIAPMVNTADLLAQKGDFDGALNMFKAALKANNVNRHNRNDYELQKEVRQLAVRFGAQGRPDDAEKIYDLYVDSRSSALGSPTQATSTALLDKAAFFMEQEQYDKASAAAVRAAELGSKFTVNQDYRLNDMARQLYERKQYEPALKLTQAWLDSLDGSNRSSQNYQIVEGKVRMANIYRALGKNAESIAILQDASKTTFDKLAATTPEIRTQLEQLVDRLIASGKMQAANEILVAIAQLNNYSRPVDGLVRVIYPLSNEHLYDECITFLQTIIEAQSKLHGPSSQQAALAMGELAQVYNRNDQSEKAAEVQKGAQAILTLARKQQQTNPQGTDIWDPKAPLADTINAAAALSPADAAAAQPAGSILINAVRGVHIRNIGR